MSKVACKYCGEEYSARGISSHERNCSENPENQEKEVVEEVDNEVEPIVVDEEEKDSEVEIMSSELKKKLTDTDEEVTLVKNDKKPLEPKKVRIVLKKYHKCNIGGNFYEFRPDTRYDVPENVKTILLGADLLKPL